MKYPKQQLDKVIKLLPILLKHYGLTPDMCKNNIPLYHNLHYRLFVQLNYDNDNLNIIKINGSRLFEQDMDFLLYPAGCNDSHIETAIKFVITNLI